jgi:hypothetical protein
MVKAPAASQKNALQQFVPSVPTVIPDGLMPWPNP